jgi:hypothetical protein
MNAVVRKRAYLMGELDNELFGGEENEFYGRLRRRGDAMEYRPELAFYHHHRATLGSHLRQMFKYGLGRGQIIARRPTLDQIPYLTPWFAMVLLAAMAAFAPLLAIACVGAYLVLLAVAAGRLGGVRYGPAAFALILGTHVQYAAGVAAGIGYEVTGMIVPSSAQAGKTRLASD